MIELQDVCKTFHEGQPNAAQALRGVSLSMRRGEVIALHGPSGSGKTTLMTLMGCMARPSSGRVWLDGANISSMPERFLTALRRKHFGFVFQQFHLMGDLSVLDNVLVPTVPLGLPRRAVLERAHALLAQMHMQHRIHARARTLSGGEQQRVAIARALINQPEVLIADEPTAHLDTHMSQEIIAIFAQLHAAGTSLILGSHDPLLLHSALVQRRVGLRDGRVVQAAD